MGRRRSIVPSYQEVHPEEVRQEIRSSKEEEEEEEEVYHTLHHDNLLYIINLLSFHQFLSFLNRRGNGLELKRQTRELSSERNQIKDG